MTGSRGYLRAREHLRRDFENRCAYCVIHERQVDHEEGFWIDHFQPKGKGGRVNQYANLYWACIACNHTKSDSWPSADQRARGYRFADPCREQDYGLHFVEDDSGYLVAHTPCGEYHLLKLRLNRESRVKRRRERSERAAKLEVALMLASSLGNRVLDPQERRAVDQIISLLREVEVELRFAIPIVPPVYAGA
jgi:uncharacterized protein (TIGR02646 family)